MTAHDLLDELGIACHNEEVAHRIKFVCWASFLVHDAEGFRDVALRFADVVDVPQEGEAPAELGDIGRRSSEERSRSAPHVPLF